MARHTLIQLCGYLGFLKLLLEEGKYPIIPILVIDHVSKPFDIQHAKALGEVLNKACKIIGKENIPIEESLIIASNHKHAMDPLMIILATKRTIHYLAKIELFKGPLKLFFNAVGTLPVDRKNRNPDTVSKAEEMLKNGGAIGIFPEGTRNKTIGTKDEVDLLPLKFGAVSLAQKTNA